MPSSPMRYISAILLLASALAIASGAPAMRVVKAGSNGTQLLVNGGFEKLEQAKATFWVGWQRGYLPELFEESAA